MQPLKSFLNKSTLSRSLLIGLFAASLGGIAAPITASAGVGIYLNIPPPPIRVEPVPAPRHGYLWIPGYWDVSHHHHVWRGGHWERERHGYHYSPPNWVQRNDRWELERGHWSRGDRDGDGVPNREDRDPDNPHRH